MIKPLALAALALMAGTRTGTAQTDEIQVYDGGLTAPGKFNLTWHNNFTPQGLTTPAYPGALIADKSLNGVPEWAYGVTPWFEAGLYMPLYSIGKRNGQTDVMLDGAKLRLLFAVPHADDRGFFYGVNFELSYNAPHWDASRVTSEIRPIIGWHLQPLDVIINPIVDVSYEGSDNVAFAPASRVACNLSRAWAFAVEEYDDFGAQPTHQLYGVVDHATKTLDLEAGVGFGLTDASDKLTFKLILSRDLN
ncbi:MAG TPA: hypothetical protein VG454_02340 [Gemmatimonadales bacterium]|nr:hypothetical protein [Gemmatimonadales bacterium]